MLSTAAICQILTTFLDELCGLSGKWKSMFSFLYPFHAKGSLFSTLAIPCLVTLLLGDVQSFQIHLLCRETLTCSPWNHRQVRHNLWSHCGSLMNWIAGKLYCCAICIYIYLTLNDLEYYFVCLKILWISFFTTCPAIFFSYLFLLDFYFSKKCIFWNLFMF